MAFLASTNSQRKYLIVLKPSLALPPHSGFVAFDGGGAIAPEPYRAAEKRALQVLLPAPETAAPEVPSVDAQGAEALWQSPTWTPAAGLRARRVEGVLIIAICAYFVLGFFKLIHWL